MKPVPLPTLEDYDRTWWVRGFEAGLFIGLACGFALAVLLGWLK